MLPGAASAADHCSLQCEPARAVRKPGLCAGGLGTVVEEPGSVPCQELCVSHIGLTSRHQDPLILFWIFSH